MGVLCASIRPWDHSRGPLVWNWILAIDWNRLMLQLVRSWGKLGGKCSTCSIVKPSDQVWALLPVVSSPFQARFSGPYTISKCLPDHHIQYSCKKMFVTPVELPGFFHWLGKKKWSDLHLQYIPITNTIWLNKHNSSTFQVLFEHTECRLYVLNVQKTFTVQVGKSKSTLEFRNL